MILTIRFMAMVFLVSAVAAAVGKPKVQCLNQLYLAADAL